MRFAIIILSAFVFLSSFFSYAEATQKEFHKTFQVTPGGKFTIETDSGSLHIVGTTDNEISVSAEIKGSEKDVAGFDVTAEQQGGEVSVWGKKSKKGSNFWNWSSRLTVVFTIQVPKQFSLLLNTSGGDVSVHSIDGTVSGRTAGGKVDMNDVKGDVEFSTNGGDIHMEKGMGNIHMETLGGNIALTELTGDVDARTNGGNIKVDTMEGKVHVETMGGNIFLKVNGENKGIYAKTNGGQITIEVPKNFAADIDAQTLGGRVQCDLPLMTSGMFDQARITGTINGGGGLIQAYIMGGDIRIKGVE